VGGLVEHDYSWAAMGEALVRRVPCPLESGTHIVISLAVTDYVAALLPNMMPSQPDALGQTSVPVS
jgi:hypothetical protein